MEGGGVNFKNSTTFKFFFNYIRLKGCTVKLCKSGSFCTQSGHTRYVFNVKFSGTYNSHLRWLTRTTDLNKIQPYSWTLCSHNSYWINTHNNAPLRPPTTSLWYMKHVYANTSWRLCKHNECDDIILRHYYTNMAVGNTKWKLYEPLSERKKYAFTFISRLF